MYSGSQHDGADIGYCRSGRNGNSICQCCQPFNNDDTDAEDNDFREEDKEIPEEDPGIERGQKKVVNDSKPGMDRGRDEASAISTLLREDLSCQSRSAEVYFFAGCIS